MLAICFLTAYDLPFVSAGVFNSETYHDEDRNTLTAHPTIGGGATLTDDNGNSTFVRSGISGNGNYYDENANTYTVRPTIAGNKAISYVPAGVTNVASASYAPVQTYSSSNYSSPNNVTGRMMGYFEAGRQMGAARAQENQQKAQFATLGVLAGMQLLSNIFSNSQSAQPTSTQPSNNWISPQSGIGRQAYAPPNNNFSSNALSGNDDSDSAKRILLRDWYAVLGPQTKSRMSFKTFKELVQDEPFSQLQKEFEDYKRNPDPELSK